MFWISRVFYWSFVILNNNETITGYFGIFLAIVGWGLSTTFIGFGLDSINPYFFLSLRFFIAVIIFAPYIIFFKRKEFLDLFLSKWVWLFAFFEFLGLEFQYIGQQYVSAGLTTLLSLQFVLFVPLLSAKFLKDPFSKVTVVSIVLALTGTFLISANGNFFDIIKNFNVGGLILLFSALSYSIYIIVSSYFTSTSDKPIDTSTMFFIVILGIALFSLIPTISLSNSFTISSSVWMWIFVLAIFSTLIPFFGYFLGVKVISANTMSLVLLLQIIVPFAIDIIFLGITYSYWIILGSLLVMASFLISVSRPYYQSFLTQKIFKNKIVAISK